jgi:hypothetical protein
VTCPGCIDRARLNKACEWTGDTAFPIDPENAAHRKHLVGDAHLAEELAIRYADAEFGRRFGIEHHGGLLEGGRVRGECLAHMFTAAASSHGVTTAQLDGARFQRNRVYDVAVGVLFLPIYVLGALATNRWLDRRFSNDERFVRVVATGLVSIPAAFLGVHFLRLWAAVWEVVRVGNGHMTSIRAASRNRSILHQFDVLLIVGILLFWLVSLYCSRVRAVRPPDDGQLLRVT